MGVGVLQNAATVVGSSLPDWLDLHFARNATLVLALIAVIILLVVVFTVRSVATRLIVVVLLGVSVFGLLHYRQTLDHCNKAGCECQLFGSDLKGGGCGTKR
jgi:hypothetical protein